MHQGYIWTLSQTVHAQVLPSFSCQVLQHIEWKHVLSNGPIQIMYSNLVNLCKVLPGFWFGEFLSDRQAVCILNLVSNLASLRDSSHLYT